MCFPQDPGMMKSQKTSRNKLTKKPIRRDKVFDAKSARSGSYDRDSGLVYDEIEIFRPKTFSHGWISDFATPNLVQTRRRPNEAMGARPLHAMIVQKLGIESQDLTLEAIQFLPWNVGQRIWESICASHTETLYIWRTFAMAFGRDFADPTRRYFLDLKSPTLPLPEYQKGITSKENHWLTCLRVSPKQLISSDLVSMSSVRNLTVLDLSDGQHSIEHRDSTFDNRVLRSWSELARAGRAFQNLRVLMLGWQEKIDTWIFDFLDDFPKLRLLIISRCRNFDHKNHRDWEDDAWSHHWTFMPSKRGVKHLQTLLDDRSLYKGKVSGMHHESGRDPSDPDSSLSTAPNIPLLEVWLGTPRPWTHIMDEYPGTGTIYFKKKRQDRSGSEKKIAPAKPTIGESKSAQIKQYEVSEPIKYSAPRRRKAEQSTASLLAEFRQAS